MAAPITWVVLQIKCSTSTLRVDRICLHVFEATRPEQDSPAQIRHVTARDVHRLAALASLFVGLHHWGQGNAAWAVALDMALSCAVILIVQPTTALMSEVRLDHEQSNDFLSVFPERCETSRSASLCTCSSAAFNSNWVADPGLNIAVHA